MYLVEKEREKTRRSAINAIANITSKIGTNKTLKNSFAERRLQIHQQKMQTINGVKSIQAIRSCDLDVYFSLMMYVIDSSR